MAAACAVLLAGVPDVLAGADRMRAPAPQELIVRFKAGAGPSERSEARSRAGVRAVRALRSGSQVVRPEPGRALLQALADLREDHRVSFAEVNGIVRAAALTDDPMLTGERLWGLHNTAGSAAFFGGTADSDVDAPEAWDLADGTGVTVAVADTGVAGGHPDLDGRMVAGWNTVDRNSTTTDVHGHGTHVAGTIAAEGANATGVVGVAHAARIMPVKVLGDDGSGTDASVADGFRWAGDHGADVVNASLGGAGFSQEIADAIDAHPDVLFVVAAGNDGADNDGTSTVEYPCEDSSANVICVAATDAGDRLSTFSNHGTTSVDLAAPGEDILSTVPSGYQYLSGTSMATPHVAGVAALVLERLGGSATVAQLREAVLQTGDPVSALATKTVTGRRLNAHAAAAHFSRLAVTTGAATAVGETTATLSGSVDTDGLATEWFFEYGPTTAYGSVTPVATAAGSSTPVAVQHAISALTASTTYHFRLVGRRGDRTVTGGDGTFTTATPPPADEPTGADEPTVEQPPTAYQTETGDHATTGDQATIGDQPSTADQPPAVVPPDPVAEMKRTARVACKRRSGRRLACRFTATGATRVVAVVKNRKGRTVGRLRGATGRTLVTRVPGLRKGRYRLAMAFFDASGRRATVTRRVRLR